MRGLLIRYKDEYLAKRLNYKGHIKELYLPNRYSLDDIKDILKKSVLDVIKYNNDDDFLELIAINSDDDFTFIPINRKESKVWYENNCYDFVLDVTRCRTFGYDHKRENESKNNIKGLVFDYCRTKKFLDIVINYNELVVIKRTPKQIIRQSNRIIDNINIKDFCEVN